MKISLALTISLFFVSTELAAAQKSRCTVDPKRLGDGWCDWDVPGANTAECNWDGGDCCESTCSTNFDCSQSPGTMCHKCGSHQYSCLNPHEQNGFVSIYDIAGTQDSWDGGIASPFSYYRSKASLVSTEDFVGLAERRLGALCTVTYERNVANDIHPDCISFPAGVSARSMYLSFTKPTLGGEEQNAPCAPYFDFTFEVDKQITMVHFQMYLTNNFTSVNITNGEELEAYFLSRSLPLLVTSQYTNDAISVLWENRELQAGAEFPEVGVMAIKGSRIKRIQIGHNSNGNLTSGAPLIEDEKTIPRWCINAMSLYTGNGDPASQAQPAVSSASAILHKTSLAITAVAVAVAML